MKNSTSIARECFCKILSFSAVRIRGAKATEFLQGQLTCDVLDINNQQAALGACCDHTGRMIANFWVARSEEDFLLFIPKRIAPHLLSHLQKFAVFSKVTLAEEKDWKILNYFSHRPLELKNLPSIIHTQILLPEQHQILHWLMCPLDNSEQLGLFEQEISEKEMRLTWILARLVFIEPETMNLFLPQMISLEKLGGVSFNKGCYVGQEIIARTQHLGQLKRHLQHLKGEFLDPPQPGETLQNEQKEVIGQIAAISPDTSSSYQILAVIQDRAKTADIFYKSHLLIPLNILDN